MPSPQSSHERTLKDLDSRVLIQFQKAQKMADQGEQEYVIRLCKNWIERNPDVVEFRELLRETQITQTARSKPNYLNGSVIPTIKMVGANSKKPKLRIQQCEEALSYSPLDIQANQILANTAKGLKWNRTCVFAWKTLLRNPKRQASHVAELASFLNELKLNDDAISLCETFLNVFPMDRRIIEARNQASIRKSIQQINNS